MRQSPLKLHTALLLHREDASHGHTVENRIPTYAYYSSTILLTAAPLVHPPSQQSSLMSACRNDLEECALTSTVHLSHRASCLYPLLVVLQACVCSFSQQQQQQQQQQQGCVSPSQGAAAERGFVLMWRQELAVNKAYNALPRARGLYRAAHAVSIVSVVSADSDAPYLERSSQSRHHK